MSNAKPMHPEARGLNYGYPLTPRQLRRYWKKWNRVQGGHDPFPVVDPAMQRKNRPTPRQRKRAPRG